MTPMGMTAERLAIATLLSVLISCLSGGSLARLAATATPGKRPNGGRGANMAKPYRETSVRDAVFATSVSTLWDWFEDRQAQVDFASRIAAITVLDGEWAVAGCRARVDFFARDGAPQVIEVETLSHDRPVSFTTRVCLPDVTTTTVHTTEEVADGVLYRQVTEMETRPIGFIIRWVLGRGRAQRAAGVEIDHAEDIAVIEAYLASLSPNGE